MARSHCTMCSLAKDFDPAPSTKDLNPMGSGWIGWSHTSDDFLILSIIYICVLYIYIWYICFFVFGDFFVDLNLGTPWPIQSWQCTVTVGKGLKLHLGAEAWHKKNANRKKGIQRWNPWLNLLLSILSRTVRMWTYWLINFFQWCSTIRWSTWDGKICQASMTPCISPCLLAAAWDFKMIPGDLAKFVLQNMPHCFIFVLVFLGWFGGMCCIGYDLSLNVNFLHSLKVLKVCGWNLSLVACANSTLWAALFGIEARSLGLCPLFWW